MRKVKTGPNSGSSILRPFDSSTLGPSHSSTSDDPESGIYVTLDSLIRLQHRVRDVSFLPKQPIDSLLSGRHAARVRGRGLNFEEIRGYLPGDDVRTMDWKVTARTRKPHVRVFTEERDRPAVMVVDQRLSMFFGSRRNMKSVTAAELAAAGVWRVFNSSDRAGAVVFDDRDWEEIRPQRSRRTVLRILHLLVEKNRALKADVQVQSNPEMLNQVLEGVARTAKHDYLVAILSDFDGADAETTRIVTRLARHNDVLAFPVYDPLSSEIPKLDRLVVSGGELQVELDTAKASIRRQLSEFADRRLASVLAWQKELAIPVLPISTQWDSLDQIRKLLGARRGGR